MNLVEIKKSIQNNYAFFHKHEEYDYRYHLQTNHDKSSFLKCKIDDMTNDKIIDTQLIFLIPLGGKFDHFKNVRVIEEF